MKTNGVVRFAEFELDIERYELKRAGDEVRLEHLPMELLILLASRKGEAVSRADIIDALWSPGSFHDTDNGINTAIYKIRLALGDDPIAPRHVKTIKGKGYRLDGISRPDEPVAAAAQPVRVMVLPFDNMTGDKNQDVLCEALAAEISATLGNAGAERLAVIARTTAAYYRRAGKSIAEIARELRLDYVLEGSLMREGRRFRILAQLIRCADQTQIWSHAYEPASAGALSNLQQLGAALAAEVTPTLTRHQLTALARRLPVVPEAHDAYLRGRYYWYRRVHFDPCFSATHALSGEDFFRSHSYFESAVEHDPAYALGYAGLALFHGATVVHGFDPPAQGWPLARTAAERALELDPELPEAHHAMAAVHYFYDWDWPKAEAEFLRALHLNPSHPEANRLYARMLMALGRDAEGQVLKKRAEQVDPFAFQGSRAFDLILSGNHQQAMRECFSRATDERAPLMYQLIATAFEVKGLLKESVDATVEALIRCNELPRSQTIRECWDSGGHDAVLQWLRTDLLSRYRESYTSPLLLAEIHARLGQPEDMFHWLDVALDDRSSRLCELRTNPWFERWRSSGRFDSLEKQIGV
ncbi:winged helix-turn-helix domain-containing protein [Paraburkholderia sp. BR14320]|uniref:winged helix-turn-helix domain-containing protein n=1 Tax=unclassified Paraburkholderia TaxID=2615204 RepID=UPI0034CF38DC